MAEKQQKGLMTSGNIYEQLIFFSIPLLLGNFFQLMYNTIDSVVVGNFVGSTALAAVGASTPIINFMINFERTIAKMFLMRLARIFYISGIYCHLIPNDFSTLL